MRKFSHFYKNIVLFGSLLSLLFFSCSDDFVPSPGKSTDDDSEMEAGRYVLSAPRNITASHGESRSISLEWEEVTKAERYYIYAANNPFETFVLVGETDKNTFSYKPLDAGVNKYIRVCAVDAAGEHSELSKYVIGSTLAQPIISDIEGVSGNEDSEVIVYWYMENDEFYKDDLQYTITCKDSVGRTVVSSDVDATEISGTNFKIDGLSPSETYVYTVKASLISAPKECEVSDEVDAETARRLRPNPPENLAATQGTELSSIVVSFTLPEKVDVRIDTNTYQPHPLYFKIYRRVLEANAETAWTEIVSHLYYTGKTELESTEDVFDSYAAGAEVLWIDESVKRGVQYEYIVKSYADNVSRVITSDLSSAVTMGWAAAFPSFSMGKTKYKSNMDGTAYESASVTFNADWEMFGTDEDWRFFLKEDYSKDLGSLGTSPSVYEKFESLEEVNSHERNYDFTTKSEDGYYQYTFIIVKAEDAVNNDSLSDEDAFIQVHASIFSLSSILNQPKLDTFEVTDGYTSKNVLSWIYEDDCEYSLVRKTLDSDGEPIAGSEKSDFLINLDNSDFPAQTDEGAAGNESGTDTVVPSESKKFNAVYIDNDLVGSGETYSYQLSATKDNFTFVSNALIAVTLGTPRPQFEKDTPDYENVTVSWEEVKQAVSYDVALYDEGKKLEVENFEQSVAGGIITCKITKPAGYNDATVSGKPLTLVVTAKSKNVNEAEDGEDKERISESSIEVRTLGPAETNVSASEAESLEEITVSWNQIDGAAGYILQRVCYKILGENETQPERTDIFYVSMEDKTISFYGSDLKITDDIMSFSPADGKITLLDKQNENVNDGYAKSQKRISWGVPFGYTVLPVLSEGDVSEIKDFYNETDLLAAIGSTKGFGQNIKASKADFDNEVEITWNKPYGAERRSNPPTVYHREYSKNGNGKWEKYKELDSDVTSVKIAVSDTYLHEYSVSYGIVANDFPSSYTETFADTETADIEQDNIGYAFRLETDDNFTASKPDEKYTAFEETVKWRSLYGDLRKVKPDSYTIKCKNLNNSSEWFDVARISLDGKVTALENNKDWYNVNMSVSGNSLTITPIFDNGSTTPADDTTHNGLLKVQRDYKHYYKLVMTRGSLNFEIGGDDSVYTYRNISDGEFCKNISLIIADAINQATIPAPTGGLLSGKEEKKNVPDATGEANFSSESEAAARASASNWGWGTYGDYKHIFQSFPGQSNGDTLISGYTIKADVVRNSNAISASVVYWLANEKIVTVSHETRLKSYEGYYCLSAGQARNVAWNCTIKYSRESSPPNITIVSVSGNESEFKKWMPFDLGSDYGSTSTSRTIFTDTAWWEVRE